MIPVARQVWLLAAKDLRIEARGLRVGGVLDSVGGIVGRVERFTGLLEHAASSPIVKFLSVGAGVKKCGHQGGKVLVPSDEQIKRLNAARLQLDRQPHHRLDVPA